MMMRHNSRKAKPLKLFSRVVTCELTPSFSELWGFERNLQYYISFICICTSNNVGFFRKRCSRGRQRTVKLSTARGKDVFKVKMTTTVKIHEFFVKQTNSSSTSNA